MVQIFDIPSIHTSLTRSKHSRYYPRALNVLGQVGNGDGEFDQPRGLAVDQTNGDIYISDQMNHRIQVFTGYSDTNIVPVGQSTLKDASFPCYAYQFGTKGHDKGQLFRPAGIALTHYHVIVCDAGNTRISVFNKKTTSKEAFFKVCYGQKGRGPCEFMDPRDVAVVHVRKVCCLYTLLYSTYVLYSCWSGI